MEFEELKKIWDTQNNKPMFIIDEEALHRTIQKKKNVANNKVLDKKVDSDRITYKKNIIYFK